MKAMVWGCRGSLATPGPDTIASGGNTSCLEVRLADDSLLVLDAGTGIRALGLTLGRGHQRPLHILLTHLHLDHIEGLGFFAPLWIQEQELHLWGPPSPGASLERRIGRYLSPPLFPVTLDEMPARIHFHDFPEGEFDPAAVIVVVLEELTRVVASLAKSFSLEREPGATLVDDVLFHGNIQKIALARNPLSIHDVEFGLAKR